MDLGLLLEGETPVMNYILFGFLGLMIIWMLITPFLSSKRNKQYMEEREKLLAKFVPGTKVKTTSGLFGEIVKVTEAKDGTKVVTIKSGSADNAMTFEVDINYIAYVDDKDDESQIDDDNMQELMKKVQETSNELDEKSLNEVNEVEQSQKEATEEIVDPFEKPKKIKKSTTTKKNKKNTEE